MEDFTINVLPWNPDYCIWRILQYRKCSPWNPDHCMWGILPCVLPWNPDYSIWGILPLNVLLWHLDYIIIYIGNNCTFDSLKTIVYGGITIHRILMGNYMHFCCLWAIILYMLIMRNILLNAIYIYLTILTSFFINRQFIPHTLGVMNMVSTYRSHPKGQIVPTLLAYLVFPFPNWSEVLFLQPSM